MKASKRFFIGGLGMLKKNRIVIVMVVLALCSALFTGCGNSNTVSAAAERLRDSTLKVY